MIQRIFISLTIAFLLGSCSTSKKSLSYFKGVDTTATAAKIPAFQPIKIMPDDELFITVTSQIPDATAIYNLPLSNAAKRNALNTTTQPQQQTFIVDENGYLNFPVLGKIKVDGLSRAQLTDLLTEQIEKNVKSPFVKVDFVNIHVNVLGEVASPGAKTINKDRFSILDAILASGDLTQYGKRDNILLIRDENGVRTYNRLNISDPSILSSPYFYLRQNDVIYVEPNKIKEDNAKYNQNSAFKLSVVSTIVGAVSIVASMVIALVVSSK